MYKPQICRKGGKQGKGEAHFGSFHGVSVNVETAENTEYNLCKLQDFHKRKTWKISRKDFARMWKAWKIKICILDNTIACIASNFISVDDRGKILTKRLSCLFVQFVQPAKNPCFP